MSSKKKTARHKNIMEYIDTFLLGVCICVSSNMQTTLNIIGEKLYKWWIECRIVIVMII